MDVISVLRARDALVQFALGNHEEGDREVDRIPFADLEALRRAAVLFAGSAERRKILHALQTREWL